MKIRPEQVDSRIAECVEAWRVAREHAAAITDQAVRTVAEKIADTLRDESFREVLAPLFKAAVKGKSAAKAAKNGKKAQKVEKQAQKQKKKAAKQAQQGDDAARATIT
jgi:hypothetical protein